MHKPALAFVITFGEGGGITEPRKRFFFHGVLFFDDFDDGRFIPVAKFVFLFLACTDKQDRHLLRWKGDKRPRGTVVFMNRRLEFYHRCKVCGNALSCSFFLSTFFLGP